jgi:hypothetical protein
MVGYWQVFVDCHYTTTIATTTTTTTTTTTNNNNNNNNNNNSYKYCSMTVKFRALTSVFVPPGIRV